MRQRPVLVVVVTTLLALAIFSPALFIQVEAAQENEPEIQTGLATMNVYRSWLDLAPMRIDPALQSAAEAHAEYYRLNYGDPNLAGMGLHMETPGLPGFTGVSMRDRARAQGYQGSVNENVGLSGSMLLSIDWFMDTINHRLPIIDPRYTEVGLATVDDGDIVFEIIVFGMPEYSQNAEPEWVIWPPAGVTGAGRSFWGEAPNPFPGATFPTGLPVTVSYFGEGSIGLDSWSITANGVEIASFGSVGSGFLSGRAGLITASEPLSYGTTYSIRAAGSAGGEAFQHSWSFTTRHDDDEPLARNGETPPDERGVPTPTVTPTSEPVETPTAVASLPVAPPAPPPGDSEANASLPPGLQNSPTSVQSLWLEMDGALYSELEVRSWLLGTDVWGAGAEPYAEASDGVRNVYYFDKARIEVANEQAELDPALLTAGLLVRDMVYGVVQVGDDSYDEVGPARIQLAGDPLEFNPDAPTYASLLHVVGNAEAVAGPRFGDPVVEVIHRDGQVSSEAGLGEYTSYGSYFPATGHNVAIVFENYLSGLQVSWWDVVGLPIAEPYWVRVMASGENRWVLVQAFERRLLTFSPSNEPAWQVEMGNVGRHYYAWRYGVDPPSS